MGSVDRILVNFSESIRKVLQEWREAKAVKIAKLQLESNLLERLIWVGEGNDEIYRKVGDLRAEIFAATTKEDIKELVIKMNKIFGTIYP